MLSKIICGLIGWSLTGLTALFIVSFFKEAGKEIAWEDMVVFSIAGPLMLITVVVVALII